MGPTDENKELLNQLSNVSEALVLAKLKRMTQVVVEQPISRLLLNMCLVLMDWAVWELGHILLRKLLT